MQGLAAVAARLGKLAGASGAYPPVVDATSQEALAAQLEALVVSIENSADAIAEKGNAGLPSEPSLQQLAAVAARLQRLAGEEEAPPALGGAADLEQLEKLVAYIERCASEVVEEPSDFERLVAVAMRLQRLSATRGRRARPSTRRPRRRS